MTTFAQAGSQAGILYLPAELIGAVPTADGPWRDQELLALPAARVAELDADTLIDALAAARRLRARADALEARALDGLDRLRDGSRYVADEAALELRITRHAAADRLDRALNLVRRLPNVLAAMDAGELEGYPAGQIGRITAHLSDAHAREVDQRLAAKRAAGTLNLTDPVALRRTVRRLVQRVDPDGQAARARAARRDRGVRLVPGEDAMCTLIGELPAEVAACAYARVDGIARTLRNAGDQRNLDQLRADVYADLLLGRDPGATAPAGAAMVFLHIPIDAALTITDDGCELAGYGPIPGPIAREIMTNEHSLWRTVLTEPGTGALKDLGRRRRRPSQTLRDLIAVRDRECAHCHRPAQRCDHDHLTEWAQHGPTAEHNGGAKCEHHHYLKNQPGWNLHHDPNTGTATITTPTGRRYTRQQEPAAEPPTPDTSGNDPPPF